MKFKLIHKETGLTFPQWATKQKHDHKWMPFVNCDGQIGMIEYEEFYCPPSFLSLKDWYLYVATEKIDGKWDYKLQSK